MKPINFIKSNKLLHKPVGMTDKECGSIYVYTDNKMCISCWKISFIDKIKILFNSKIWLLILSGSTQYPVKLTTNYPFSKVG